MALTYSLNAGGTSYSVVSNSCTAGDVTIPNTNNGLPVTAIGDYAFQSCTSITSIIIPSSVNSIGQYAFNGCTSLTSVTFTATSSVAFIGQYAFYNCGITSISIPNSVTFLGYAAFINCPNLTSAIIGNGITSFRAGFSACANLSNVSLPNTLIELGSDTFRNCSNLVNITLPNNINAIRDGAFYGCTKLNNITIPSKVITIEYLAFYSCTSLTKINFLGNPPTLGGSDVFTRTNADFKIYRKKNFVTGWSSTFGGKPVVLISDNVVKSGGSGKLTTKKRYLYKATGSGLTPNINGLGFYESGLIYNGKKSFYSEDGQYAIWYWGGFPTAIWLIGTIANIGTFTTNAWGKVGATDTVAGSYIAAGDKVGTVIIS
jgi:hypothetical protein